MYLWKSWRSTRLIVGLYLLFLVIIGWAVFRHASMEISLPANDAVGAWNLLALVVGPFGFVAWMIGSLGISRDIADGSGAFLLSRPRARKFFVWSDVAVAMAEILTLALATVALLLAILSNRINWQSPAHLPHVAYLQIQPHLPASAALVMMLSLLLYGSVIFGVTYLCMALVRRAVGGITLAALIFAAYAALRSAARSWNSFPRFNLPDWLLTPFAMQSRELRMSHHFLESVIVRLTIVCLLIVAAQFMVERAEIKA